MKKVKSPRRIWELLIRKSHLSWLVTSAQTTNLFHSRRSSRTCHSYERWVICVKVWWVQTRGFTSVWPVWYFFAVLGVENKVLRICMEPQWIKISFTKHDLIRIHFYLLQEWFSQQIRTLAGSLSTGSKGLFMMPSLDGSVNVSEVYEQSIKCKYFLSHRINRWNVSFIILTGCTHCVGGNIRVSYHYTIQAPLCCFHCFFLFVQRNFGDQFN